MKIIGCGVWLVLSGLNTGYENRTVNLRFVSQKFEIIKVKIIPKKKKKKIVKDSCELNFYQFITCSLKINFF